MGPKMKKEAEKDKLTSCVQCSAVFCAKEGEKHSTEWCESLKSRKLAQFLIQSSHGCHVGNILVLKTTEDLEISPGKLVRDDILSVQLSLSTMKLAEIGVGEAVWVHSSDGSKSVALVQPIDHLPIFTCQVKPKLVSCGFLLLQKSESPVLEAKDIQIEFFKKKAFIRDSNFHRVLLLKFLERPVYSGQIVVVNYFAQRVELKLKEMSCKTEESDNQDVLFVNEALKDLSLNQLDSNDSALNVTPMKFRPENWLSSTPNLKNRQTIDTDQIYWVTDKTTFTTGNLQEIEDEISFEQIGGCHKAKEDLKAFLINPLKISEVPHCNSFLLYGVSGTGKTLLGKSLKFETNLTTHFILPSDADVKQRVTELTRNCQRSQPALIVADNFDAFVEGKGKESQNLQTFWCSTLDSLRGTPMVFVAITNRLENIDSRLRSRFDVEVEVMVPNEVERKEILSQLIHRFNHCLTDSDSEVVSGKAHGYTGADLNAVCRQAASLAMRRKTPVSLQDLLESLTRVRPSAMKEVTLEIPKVYWSDIGGMKEVKENLYQSVEWPLKHREAFHRLGIKAPVGVLLYGPPGCSKTLIAKALATESGLNFLSIKGPEVFSKWVGDSEKAVRDIFNKARQAAPCVIFFDEIDSLATSREASESSQVSNRVLTQILAEMDGIEGLENVFILGATNRPDTIDSALLRPGRLDRLIYVPLPDTQARCEIFNIRLKKTPADLDVNLMELVNRTEGFSGAEVVAVCNEAALEAMKENIEITSVAMRHFEKALKVVTARTDPKLLKVYERFHLGVE